jgi:hypothetical protein
MGKWVDNPDRPGGGKWLTAAKVAEDATVKKPSFATVAAATAASTPHGTVCSVGAGCV